MRRQPDWMDHAACTGVGDKFILPEDTSRQGWATHQFWAVAREICAGCVVRPQCLRHAMTEVPVEDECMYAGLPPTRRRQAAVRFRERLSEVST